MSVLLRRSQPSAVLDANVLVPAALCDALLRLAADGFFRPCWSKHILAETERTLVTQIGIPSRKARRRIASMNAAFPDASVSNLGTSTFGLPDPDDEHVLAAAVASQSRVIVTLNHRDFPAGICAAEGVAALTPDDFLLRLWHSDHVRIHSVIYAQVGALRAPSQSLSTVLRALQLHAPMFVQQLAESIANDLAVVLPDLKRDDLSRSATRKWQCATQLRFHPRHMPVRRRRRGPRRRSWRCGWRRGAPARRRARL